MKKITAFFITNTVKKTAFFLWNLSMLLLCMLHFFSIPSANAQTSQVSFAHSTTTVRIKVVWIANDCKGVKWGQTNVCAAKTIIPGKTIRYTFRRKKGAQVVFLNEDNSSLYRVKDFPYLKIIMISL